MKKLLLILILIGALFLLYYTYTNSPATTSVNDPSDRENFAPSPENATFTFDEEKITLSNGKSADEDGIVDEVRLLDEEATGDLNGDGKLDSVVLLARSGGGSGVFIYVAAFVSGPISYKGSHALYIGDRVAPESIEVEGNVVTVHYLDRNPDEAFAAEPTVPSSKEFLWRNGAFEER